MSVMDLYDPVFLAGLSGGSPIPDASHLYAFIDPYDLDGSANSSLDPGDIPLTVVNKGILGGLFGAPAPFSDAWLPRYVEIDGVLALEDRGGTNRSLLRHLNEGEDWRWLINGAEASSLYVRMRSKGSQIGTLVGILSGGIYTLRQNAGALQAFAGTTTDSISSAPNIIPANEWETVSLVVTPTTSNALVAASTDAGGAYAERASGTSPLETYGLDRLCVFNRTGTSRNPFSGYIRQVMLYRGVAHDAAQSAEIYEWIAAQTGPA